MAKCVYSLPEDLIKKLSRTGKEMDDISKSVLKEGGEIVEEALRDELKNVLSGESSGELISALGVSGARLDKDGNYNVKVGFAEPRKDGSSNAMVANILEYGKSNQPPRPFLKKAKKKSQKPCMEKMTEMLRRELEK